VTTADEGSVAVVAAGQGGGTRAEVTGPRAALLGVVTAALALALAELPGTFTGRPTMVVAVGSRFIDGTAGSLKDLAVAVFGTSDKAALVTGIVVLSLGSGALLGLGSRRRTWVMPAGLTGFLAVGLWAVSRDPQASLGAAGLGGALGVATATAFHARAMRSAGNTRPAGAAGDPRGTAGDPRVTAATRRTFLVWAGGGTAASAVVAATGQRLRAVNGATAQPLRVSQLPPPVQVVPVPAAQPFAVPNLTPFVTPTADFYRIDTALAIPRVDVSRWRLAVGGRVDRPFELSYDDLLALDMVEEAVTIQCVSNEVGGDLVGTARWQGVPLLPLLERAGLHDDATQVVGRSVDGWTAGFPTEILRDGRSALLVVGMNGEPLPPRHGYPARLVVAGLYGYVSATKWLDSIELTTWEDFDGFWVPRGWSKEGPIKTQSRIDVPRRNDRLVPGDRVRIGGVAWAPTRGISTVEVSTDGGTTWSTARLGLATTGNTWVQWVHDWTPAQAGTYELVVRATDGDGATQTGEVRPPAPDGATGWHRRRVTVRDV
jgi:DMSO/TMAO reductase YedYZ molybdopterin-dependent catalytic subunit